MRLDITEKLVMFAIESVAAILFGVCLNLTGTLSIDAKARKFADAVSGHFSAESKLLFSIPFHRFFKTPTLKDLHHCLDNDGTCRPFY